VKVHLLAVVETILEDALPMSPQRVRHGGSAKAFAKLVHFLKDVIFHYQ
jgi:hypothetical protein